jgi:hypothetical protein
LKKKGQAEEDTIFSVVEEGVGGKFDLSKEIVRTRLLALVDRECVERDQRRRKLWRLLPLKF